MLVQCKIKEKIRVKGRRKPETPTVSYYLSDSISEAEIEQRLDRAFDILFSEVFKTFNIGE